MPWGLRSFVDGSEQGIDTPPGNASREMRILRRHRLALLIVLLHLVLGVVYSVAVPLWEAYDEWGHYPYVRYIATYRALPPRDERLSRTHDTVRGQPPLYYILGAAATFWIDTSDWHSPHLNRYSSLPTAMGGYNRALHGYDEDFPWRGWVLAAHVTRFVSVILSTITVWLTYLIGKTLFPNRPEVAWAAMAINAFWPQALFIGSVINNDNLVATLAALLLWFMVRSVIGPPRWGDRMGLLGSLAAAIAAKIIGAAFLPVALWGLAWSCGKEMRRSFSRKAVWAVILVLLAFGVLAGVFVLSHSRYIERFQSFLNPPTVLHEMTLDRWRGIAGVMWGTLWASFGWQSVGIDEWVYQAVQPVWLVALAGLVWFFLRSRDRAVKWALAGLAGAVVLVAAGTAYRGLFSAYYFTGRYLLSTISAFSTLLAVGLSSLGPRRWNRFILGAVGGGMLAFAIYAPFAYIVPVYARPTMLPPEAVENLKQPLQVDFGHKIELVGYEMEPTTFYPGQTVKVSLYWQCLDQMDYDYTLALKILGKHDAEYAALNVHPGRGNYPTSLWRKGNIFKDTYWLPVAGDVSAPTVARLKVAFFRDRKGLEHLPAYDAQGQPIGFAALFGRLKVAAVRPAKVSPQHPVSYRLGEAVRLTGYDLPEHVSPGDVLPLTLYWQASGHTDRPYTVFVHVVDEHGRMAAQADSQPAEGSYPTDLWGVDEAITDPHALSLPAELTAGSYQVAVGLYSLETQGRLPVLDGQDKPVPDNQIVLGAVRVGR